MVASLIQSRFGARPLALLDVGCASGAFLHHARQTLSIREAVGMDTAEVLLARAKELQPTVEFVLDSVLAPSVLKGRQFDVTVCLGVCGFFDDLLPVVQNLWSFVRPGGSLYMYELGNDDPVDVTMRYRRVDGPEPGEWHSGFSVRSRLTFERILKTIDPSASLQWRDFEMPFALKKVDPMRAWTMQTAERAHQLMVGTGQMLNFKVVEMHRPQEQTT